jgi:MFS superfamily sulfate permease-like transporter
MLTTAILAAILAVILWGFYQIPPIKRWCLRMWKKHFELILTLIIAVGFSVIVIPIIIK